MKATSLKLKISLKKPLLWALTVGLLTAIYTLSLPNFYRSEARLLPVESKGISGSLGGLASAAAAFGVSVPGADSSDANFLDVLNSRWLREQLLRAEFTYHMRSWRFGAEQTEKGTLFTYLHAKNMDQAVRGVDRVLFTSRDLKSKVITISAETTSPELSQFIVQQTGRLLETFLQEKGRTRGSAKAAFAESRLADARREMGEAEEMLRQFLETNRNYLSSADPSVRLKGQRLEAELHLHQQLVTSIAMNREQALLEEKNDIPILNVLDPGNLPIDKSKPGRATIVLSMALLAAAVYFAYENREWILTQFQAHGDDSGSGRSSDVLDGASN